MSYAALIWWPRCHLSTQKQLSKVQRLAPKIWNSMTTETPEFEMPSDSINPAHRFDRRFKICLTNAEDITTDGLRKCDGAY